MSDIISKREQRIDHIFSWRTVGDNTLPSLYSVLDSKARSWWYHSKLRKQGEIKEARDRERRSILDSVRHLKQALRNGGYATIAQSGGTYSISYADGCSVTGHDESLIVSAYIAGLPVIDFRQAPNAVAILNMSLPCIGDSKHTVQHMADDVKRLGDKYPSPYSYVPIHVYMQEAMRAGATIHHAPTSRSRDNHYSLKGGEAQ